jgi:hypothetical protein
VTNVLMAASGDGDVLAQANALIDSLEVLLQEQRLFSAGKDTV